MNNATIDFVEYDENWIAMFEKEKELLTRILGENLICIEHFGSTSIPGLSAKPIIDIFVFVRDINNIEQYHNDMESHGYAARGEQALTGCKVFVKHKDNSNKRTHKVNICKENNTFSKDALLFRDYLRINPMACKDYENLKRKLSRKYYDDPIAYGNGKLDYISKTIEEAKEYFGK